MEMRLRNHLKICNDNSIKDAFTGIVNNKEVLFTGLEVIRHAWDVKSYIRCG